MKLVRADEKAGDEINMKHFCALMILIAIAIVPSCAQNPAWCELNTIYFQHSNSSDIPGYEELRNYPSGYPESDENVTITSASGLVLIDTYITPQHEPGVIALEPGLRRYRTYHYVDKSIGITRFVFTQFVRHSSGTETNLYTVITEDIDSVVVNEYLTSYVIANITNLDKTDRIGVRVYVNTTSSTAIQTHFVYEGATHHSHIDSGYYLCDEQVNDASDEPLTPIGIAFGVVGGMLGALIVSRRSK